MLRGWGVAFGLRPRAAGLIAAIVAAFIVLASFLPWWPFDQWRIILRDATADRRLWTELACMLFTALLAGGFSAWDSNIMWKTADELKL
jgi:hypothetical protein